MAATTLLSPGSNYANKNVNVDASITTGSFTNSARVVIFAKPSGQTGTFKPIGVVQGWSFTEQRQMEDVFELGSDIKYTVPGRTTGSIAITRLLINGRDLLNVLYDTVTVTETSFKSLKDINIGLDIIFQTYHNSTDTSTSDPEHMRRYFSDCWIVARQESITANQVVIAENCTLTYKQILSYNAVDNTGVGATSAV